MQQRRHMRRPQRERLLASPAPVAVVGAGAFGRFCIDAYGRTDDLKVTAVADSNAEALALVTSPGVRREIDWREVLRDEQIEVVHIATPPFLRTEIALAVIASGKSIFCEKPLALTLRDADTIIDAARVAGVTVGVDYVMRHLPAYQFLKAAADSGALGRLRTFSLQNFAQFMPAGHWFWDEALSGGILVEHGVHFFDAYAQIAGPPSRVGGEASRREAVAVTVQYVSGAVGRFFHEFAYPVQVERTVGISFFERGYVEIDGWIPVRLHGAVLAPPDQVQHIATRLALPVNIRREEATHFEIDFRDRQGSYAAAVIAGMRDVVRRHRDAAYHMTVPVEDARESLALALAAREAVYRQKVVEVNRKA